jgi:cell division protein FtsB
MADDRRSGRPSTAARRAAVDSRATRTRGGPATAAAFAPAPRPVEVPRRPRLRVVDPAVARRQRRIRRLTLGMIVVTAISLFVLVGFHVVMVQQQLALEQTEQQAVTARAHYEQLRYEVAQLSSPALIVSAAENRLHMVVPKTVTFIPAFLPGVTAQTADPVTLPANWAEVKKAIADVRP